MIEPIEHDETLDEQYSGVWSHHGDGPAPSAAAFLANHPDASFAECRGGLSRPLFGVQEEDKRISDVAVRIVDSAEIELQRRE